MTRKLQPARSVKGRIWLPGDKSISHRYAILAAVAEGRSVIRNYSTGADCAATLECLRRLSVPIDRDGNEVIVEGGGLSGLKAPAGILDAGNSARRFECSPGSSRGNHSSRK